MDKNFAKHLKTILFSPHTRLIPSGNPGSQLMHELDQTFLLHIFFLTLSSLNKSCLIRYRKKCLETKNTAPLAINPLVPHLASLPRCCPKSQWRALAGNTDPSFAFLPVSLLPLVSDRQHIATRHMMHLHKAGIQNTATIQYNSQLNSDQS